MKKVFFLFLYSLLTFFFTSAIYAESSYVLPYPSVMPGSKLYFIHRTWEKLQKYWYFGNFGQFTYNLKEADMYLVEAKTLFEYKQFLLAEEALKQSNNYSRNIYPYLIKAKTEGIDITEKKNKLKSAFEKHIEVLEKTKKDVPPTFTWVSEQSTPQNLNIQDLINESIAIRKKYL